MSLPLYGLAQNKKPLGEPLESHHRLNYLQASTVFSGPAFNVRKAKEKLSGSLLFQRDSMRRTDGFSLIELLVVIAIILIISALGLPSILRSRIAADEAAAASTIKLLNSAEITYNSTYPTVGYAATLAALGGSNCNPPTTTGACLIDTVLAAGTKSGYSFNIPSASVTGTPNATYQVIASPVLYNYYGMRYFCSYADAVVRANSTTIATCDGTIMPLQ
jgi:type IV pilus assembly protein PilA